MSLLLYLAGKKSNKSLQTFASVLPPFTEGLHSDHKSLSTKICFEDTLQEKITAWTFHVQINKFKLEAIEPCVSIKVSSLHDLPLVLPLTESFFIMTLKTFKRCFFKSSAQQVLERSTHLIRIPANLNLGRIFFSFKKLCIV